MSSLTETNSCSISSTGIPSPRVKTAKVMPWSPVNKSSRYQAPSIFILWPLAQVPRGHSYRFSTTSSNPAPSRYVLYLDTRVQSLPSALLPCISRRTHVSSAVPLMVSVDTCKWNDTVLELEITSWAKVIEGRLYDVEMWSETGSEGSSVDIVELLGEVPWVFCVVNYELTVWWNTGRLVVGLYGDNKRCQVINHLQIWLDWAQVCPCHNRRRKHVC